MAKRVTLKRIAEECKLSVPTVSQILNNREINFSSEATRNMVKETAKKLGYRPNIGYKVMRGISTKCVGILIGHHKTMFAEYNQRHIHCLLSMLSDRGYSVLTRIMGDDWSKRPETLYDLEQRGVEHIISIGPPCDKKDLDEFIKKTGISFLMTLASDFRNTVDIDVEFGAVGLLEFFKKSGCRKIRSMIVDDPPRLRALEKVFGREMVPEIARYFDRGLVSTLDGEAFLEKEIQAGYEFTRQLLKNEPETDAIFYLSDYFAVGGAKYIHETGRVIGKDILLSGYNNTRVVRAFPFPISSVDHNIVKMSETAVENFTKDEAQNVLIKPKVVIRTLF